MAVHVVRAGDRDSLARFLGWFSVALGGAELAAPQLVCKAVGASTDGRAPMVARLMGVREVASGLGILTRPRPTAWVWSRVGGDAVDLTLLGLTFARRPEGRGRTLFAIANVLTIAVADVKEAQHLSGLSGPPRSGRLIRKAVTINRSRDEVEQRWQASEVAGQVREADARVSFQTAPGDRGTELVVEFVEDPPAGELGAVVQKATGHDLATELADELRRLKQQIETGEVVRSDSTPDGHLLSGHLKQRPAMPLEEAIR